MFGSWGLWVALDGELGMSTAQIVLYFVLSVIAICWEFLVFSSLGDYKEKDSNQKDVNVKVNYSAYTTWNEQEWAKKVQ